MEGAVNPIKAHFSGLLGIVAGRKLNQSDFYRKGIYHLETLGTPGILPKSVKVG